MKKLIWALMVAGIVCASAAPAAGADRPLTIRERQRIQQRRIGAGVANGRLTPRETVRLERKQARLSRKIRRDRVDGGGLSARERIKINRRQNRLGRQIYREKHDAQRVR